MPIRRARFGNGDVRDGVETVLRDGAEAERELALHILKRVRLDELHVAFRPDGDVRVEPLNLKPCLMRGERSEI
ncbi:MAG: hypothetical protein ABI874_14140 [Chloroflexota bacterium]